MVCGWWCQAIICRLGVSVWSPNIRSSGRGASSISACQFPFCQCARTQQLTRFFRESKKGKYEPQWNCLRRFEYVSPPDALRKSSTSEYPSFSATLDCQQSRGTSWNVPWRCVLFQRELTWSFVWAHRLHSSEYSFLYQHTVVFVAILEITVFNWIY